VNPHCVEFECNNWVLSKHVIERLVPLVGIHPFPLNELLLMSAALCRIHPKHVFEWGTNIGKSARIFYETSKCFGLGTTIHSIDLPETVAHVEHPGKRRGALVRGLRDVILYEGDGLDVASKLGHSMVNQGPFLFFLDGDHSYESVRRELSSITEQFSSSSVLIHDTFYQSAESSYNVGPYEAVQSVMRDQRDPYRIIATSTGLPGMTLLYRARS